MPEEYSQEELQEIYDALPKELQEALFSDEVAGHINDICARNGLEEEKIGEMTKYVGYVLLGLLSPNEFEKTIRDKMSLKGILAKKVSQEVAKFIFFPLKASLELLYNIEIMEPEEEPEEKPKEDLTSKREGKDVYREPIE